MRQFFAALIACCGMMPAAMAQEALPSAPSVLETQQEATVYHSGWAILDASGNLSGQVVTVGNNAVAPQAGSQIDLISSTGPVASAMAAADGTFTLAGVMPGIYELRAASEAAYAAHGIQVMAHKPGMDSGLMVYASGIAPAKAEEILRTLAVPQSMQTAPAFGPLVEPPMPVVQSHRIALSNGVVNGRLAFTNGYGAPQVHSVQLLRDGQVIDKVQVDGMGFFRLKPEGTGAYDVIVGGIGHGVFGIEVVDTSVQLTGKKSKLVAKNNRELVQQTLLVPVAMPASAPQNGVIVEEFAGGPTLGGGFPAPGGGFSGGGFSGGGGGGGLGGGLGGAGGLLGIAGLAVGVAALSDDDDGFNGNLATPVAP